MLLQGAPGKQLDGMPAWQAVLTKYVQNWLSQTPATISTRQHECSGEQTYLCGGMMAISVLWVIPQPAVLNIIM